MKYKIFEFAKLRALRDFAPYMPSPLTLLDLHAP